MTVKLHEENFKLALVRTQRFLRQNNTWASALNIFSGELLTMFFFYYADTFDFTRDVGSVRTGKVLRINDCEAFARENKV